eukprot:TRINITY_DN22970_c0_g1_i1.p1 TRINITY_DN22970_c0_g1~~TRINITY_DN22970_c0_g1_i1.p1  ORF type:complete len:793 (+),score=126.50 TRINITY_DN22970_c0_g1_i1:120-2498(+)
MGCGRVSQPQPPLVGSVPGHFLRSYSDGEFVRSLQTDELNDKNRLLAYYHLLKDGQFEPTARFTELVRRRGVPQRYRWLAWRTLSKWTSIYRPGVYDACCQLQPSEAVRLAIRKDLDRTFPMMEEFDEDKKLKLNGMLCAYASLFPQVGYCQGMNFIAGFILLISEDRPEDAFFMFVQMMVRYRASLFFCEGLPLLKVFSFQFLTLLENIFPDVHNHFLRECVTPELYLTKWLLTVFAQPLPFACAARLWDLIVSDGLQATVLLALAIVKLLRPRLLKESAEGILELMAFRAEGSRPLASTIVRTALSLKLPGLCGNRVEVRMGKLRDLWAQENPDEAAALERFRGELCVVTNTLLDPAVPDAVALAADATARSALSPFPGASLRHGNFASVEAPLTKSSSVLGANSLGAHKGQNGNAGARPNGSPGESSGQRLTQARPVSGDSDDLPCIHMVAAEAKVDLQSSIPSRHSAAMRWVDGRKDERQRSRFPAYARPSSRGSNTEYDAGRGRAPPVERRVPAGRRLRQSSPDERSSSKNSVNRDFNRSGAGCSQDPLGNDARRRMPWYGNLPPDSSSSNNRLRQVSRGTMSNSPPSSASFPTRYGRPASTEYMQLPLSRGGMRALSPPEKRPFSGGEFWGASASTTADSGRTHSGACASARSRSGSNGGLRRARTRSFSPINLAPALPPPSRLFDIGRLPQDPLDLRFADPRPDTAGSLERIALTDFTLSRGRQQEMTSAECRAYSVESEETGPSPLPTSSFYPSPASCKRHAWMDDDGRIETSRSSVTMPLSRD